MTTYYTIYQTTNLVNGKIYIGQHQTKNLEDEYLGSGGQILRAIKKYGKEQFSKEILFVFETYDEMNTKEIELVTEEFVSRKDNYNTKPGGQNDTSALANKSKADWCRQGTISFRENQPEKFKMTKFNAALKMNETIKLKDPNQNDRRSRWAITRETYGNTFGKYERTDEWRQNLSQRSKLQTGEKNSQHGTKWMSNGIENKKVKPSEIEFYLSEGFTLGRQGWSKIVKS